MASPNKVTWFELPATDTTRAGTFYTDVFGWDTQDMGAGSLVLQSGPSDESMSPIERGSINGDISPKDEIFDTPLVVIQVENIDEILNNTINSGGQTLRGPVEIPEMGMKWAIIQDTEGNKVGVSQMTD